MEVFKDEIEDKEGGLEGGSPVDILAPPGRGGLREALETIVSERSVSPSSASEVTGRRVPGRRDAKNYCGTSGAPGERGG